MGRVTQDKEEMSMYLKYRIKAIYRWFVMHLARNVEYSAYSNPVAVGGYLGAYNWRDRCIAFKRFDGSIQYMW
jgi:hypothetical protein